MPATGAREWLLRVHHTHDMHKSSSGAAAIKSPEQLRVCHPELPPALSGPRGEAHGAPAAPALSSGGHQRPGAPCESQHSGRWMLPF